MRFGSSEMLMLVLIVLLLFGAARLPKLARSMREAREEFQKGQDAAKPLPADGAEKAAEEPAPTESDQK
jgi:sec-independent protein translocase protein TatA